ncbi:hypothetical protein K4F52_005581 [Lecanicillium sp. MT-2017a]|nr:hypothetical protein K4F52_005581 [Lecanicillium sp. MT-2017a]
MSPSKLHSGVSDAEVLKHHEFDKNLVERVGFRKRKLPLAIVEPDPAWPARYAEHEAAILSALGPKALELNHVGSTSVPGLPAKDVIDIDLTVADVDDEDDYVPALEAAGFQFKHREPFWHGHRFFCTEGPNWCNLHVWGPNCPEALRHILFRDWLREHPDDCEAYVAAKRSAADATNAAGEDVMAYNYRKENFIWGLLELVLNIYVKNRNSSQ